MHGVDSGLKTTLVRGSLGVDGGHVVDRSTCFNQFHVSLFLATVSRVQESPSFLKLTLKGKSTPISQASLLSNLTALTALLLKETLNFTKLSLEPLDGLVSLRVCLVGMIKSNFQLIDIRFKLLLDTKGFTLSSIFCIKRCLKRIHGTLVVFASVIKLLNLFLNLAINLLANLSKLKLSSEDFVFLLL